MMRLITQALLVCLAFLTCVISISTSRLIYANPASKPLEKPDESQECHQWSFNQDHYNFSLATVTGTKNAKVMFTQNNLDSAKPTLVKHKPYLIPGNKVLVTKIHNGWGCSFFRPAKGNITAGWLPLKNLQFSATKRPRVLNNWVGVWKQSYGTITIKQPQQPEQPKQPGQFAVSGEAFYTHRVSEDILEPCVHLGQFSAQEAPKRNTLTLQDDTCTVGLTLLSPYIIAKDNLQCGGANVSFIGIYRKMPNNPK